VRQARSTRPGVDSRLRPLWDRHRSDVSTLADQIGDHPVFLPLLDGFQPEPECLAAPQTASQEQGHHGMVADNKGIARNVEEQEVRIVKP